MSYNLYWKPVVSKRHPSLPDALKLVMREEYGTPLHETVNEDDRGFFRGLAAAKVEGAEEVLDLIDKHGTVELWEGE